MRRESLPQAGPGITPQLLLPLSGGLWERVRDGDPRWRVLYQRHYSAHRYRDGRQPSKIIGPGEYLLLATPTLDAIFAWRRFRSMDDQTGVGCCVFRNEGPTLYLEAVKTIEIAAWNMEAMTKALHEDARQLALALDVEPYDQRKPDRPEEGSMEDITELVARLAAKRRRESS